MVCDSDLFLNTLKLLKTHPLNQCKLTVLTCPSHWRKTVDVHISVVIYSDNRSYYDS